MNVVLLLVSSKDNYAAIKERWLSAYNELEEIDGLSVKHEITADDEWCAEAYLNTDYSVLSERLFERKLNDYLAFDIAERVKDPEGEETPTFLTLSGLKKPFSVLPQDPGVKLDTKTWKPFRYDDVFKIMKGFYNKKPETFNGQDIPFIGATDSNNGITERYCLSDIEDASKTGDDPNQPITQKLFSPNCITVSNNGSIGYAFYQTRQFTCTHDVNPLYLKNHQLNKYLAMFLCTLIELDRYRWAYGRKWRPKRMPSSIIKLPVCTDGSPDWKMMEDYKAELESGRCLTGPHKDDFEVFLDGRSLKSFGSQGQTRTAAIALKLSEREIARGEDGEEPVLLLDDVLSELDRKRQDVILNELRSGQVFITCCETEKVTTAGQVFFVRDGNLFSENQEAPPCI